MSIYSFAFKGGEGQYWFNFTDRDLISRKIANFRILALYKENKQFENKHSLRIPLRQKGPKMVKRGFSAIQTVILGILSNEITLKENLEHANRTGTQCRM